MECFRKIKMQQRKCKLNFKTIKFANFQDKQLNTQHRHELLDNSEGLLSAIALPNDLEDEQNSSNQRFNDLLLKDKIQMEMNKIRYNYEIK